MDKLTINYRAPVVTGRPGLGGGAQAPAVQPKETESFETVFKQKLQESQSVAFSKHAAARMEERGIDLSDESLERLNKGVQLAGQKGLDDTLILMDRNAFLVSARNRTVITALSGSDLTGSVFTNIDGTVVI